MLFVCGSPVEIEINALGLIMLIDQCHPLDYHQNLLIPENKLVYIQTSGDIGPAFNEHKQGRITCFAFWEYHKLHMLHPNLFQPARFITY